MGELGVNDFRSLVDRLRTNEELARKFFEIETTILSILNYKDLLEVLLKEIKGKFNVPLVCINLVQESKLTKFIKSVVPSETFSRTVILSSRELLDGVVSSNRPVLINVDLDKYEDLLPRTGEEPINSIALIPLAMDGERVGCLNLADTDVSRFRPGMDTGFLEQLSVVVSICLSNVSAHEKLRSALSRKVKTRS